MAKLLHILMVDDDPDEHLLFREALKDLTIHGVPALAAISLSSVYNGVQAFDFLLKRGAYKNIEGTLPDVMVLDLNMPVMDGFTVLHELRKFEDLTRIPVYVLTTTKNAEHKTACEKLGCAGFNTKPANVKTMRKLVEEILAGIEG